MSDQTKPAVAVSRKEIILWLLVFGVPIVFALLPLNLDRTLQLYFAIAMWGVLAWMTTIIPAGIVGASLPCLFLFFGVMPAEAAFSPWANTVIWGTISILLVGYAADVTGIARRMAYALLLRFDCSIKGLVWGFAGAGLVLAFIIIDPMCRALIFITIALGIVRALDIPFKSKEATALGLAAFFGMSGPSIMVYTSGVGIYINSVYRNIAGNINYLEWLIGNLVPGLAWTLISVLVILKTFKLGDGRCFDAREVLEAEQRALGKLSYGEKMTLVVLILLVIDYIFAPMADLDPLLVSALPMALFFLPKIGILKAEDFELANLKILFVMTGAMAIGAGANSVGLVDMMVDAFSATMGTSPVVMAIGAFFIAAIGNFVLTPLAIVFTLTEAITTMAMSFGFNPLPIVYALNFGTDFYIFPYEYAIFLLCFSFGFMDYKLTIKAMLLRAAGALLIFFAIFLPYWTLLGYF